MLDECVVALAVLINLQFLQPVGKKKGGHCSLTTTLLPALHALSQASGHRVAARATPNFCLRPSLGVWRMTAVVLSGNAGPRAVHARRPHN